ncbi:metalloprotease 1 [Colletotrichum orchidophilum]|uniref:Metalloprotease 1 n=1 Tax=Colletotrichum orchidophilum TaxID=1209926 RepID=A0A1G4BQ00_9PEZI|nr:metalloprotease 1 [Colletotrichum orchidophilum]OHF03540.1 metalloprotease 1 [Colletotrichum orchidophilum]
MICQNWTLHLLGIASLASVALAQPSQRPTISVGTTRSSQYHWCGTDEGNDHLGGEDDLVALEALSKRSLDTENPIGRKNPIKIPVNIFLVGTEEQRGELKENSALLQIEDALAEGYSQHGIFFGPIETYQVAGDEYVNVNHSERKFRQTLDMKEGLRIGGAETLNVYVVPKLDRGTLGYAVFPWILSTYTDERALAMDGVVLGYWGLKHFLSRKAIVHEVGHFLGLLHPFQGGCKSLDGDSIPDTPQATYVSQHCEPKDTCPQLPGHDLIKNYMMYSACSEDLSFTPGQVSRMREAWYKWRDPQTRKLTYLTSEPIRTTPNSTMIVTKFC